jgi:hypothetical protein
MWYFWEIQSKCIQGKPDLNPHPLQKRTQIMISLSKRDNKKNLQDVQ